MRLRNVVIQIALILDKAWAVFRREMLTALRYRAGFALSALSHLAELAVFFFLARSIGPGYRPEGQAYFPFLLVGTGFYSFLLNGISSFLTMIQEAQTTGTLEVLMTTSTSPSLLVILSAFSSFVRSAAGMLLYFLGGVILFGATLPSANFASLILVLALSLLVMVGLGLFAAAVQLAIQRGSAILWIIGTTTWMMTGTLFPVSALPVPLQIMAQAFPLTHALTAMRLALLHGVAPSQMIPELGKLALGSLLLPLGWLAFRLALRQARSNGSLSYY